ncbi:hypothetical protein [Bacillus sp. X1(2014)]|uniref:hypothetical protein n=1 Tax=Bacillus sp. X1(2014) TaxID=1565991 RepID=UPI0037BE88B1
MSARLGWLPSFPQLSQNLLEVMKEARSRTVNDLALIDDVAKQLKEGNLDFAIENPNDLRNFPLVFLPGALIYWVTAERATNILLNIFHFNRDV